MNIIEASDTEIGTSVFMHEGKVLVWFDDILKAGGALDMLDALPNVQVTTVYLDGKLRDIGTMTDAKMAQYVLDTIKGA
jgi:hypothetical protein